MQRATRVNLALSVVTVLVLLLGAELAARLYHGCWSLHNLTGVGADFDTWQGNFHVTQYPWTADPDHGWIPTPMSSATMAGWSNRRLSTRELGIRSNGSPWPDPGPGGNRPLILAVGDSFTFGDQVADNQTWPARLEQLLQVRVINGGVFGYGLDQSFLRARTLRNAFHPQLLVCSLIFSDIFRCEFSVSFGVRKPYFVYDEAQSALRLEDQPVPPQPLPGQQLDLPRRVLGHSMLVHHFMARLDPTYWFTGRHNLRIDDRGGRPVSGLQVACPIIKLLAEEAAADGTHLLVLVQATTFDDAVQDRLLDPFYRCVSSLPVTVLDLRYPLRRLRSSNQEQYEAFFDQHMTAAGNDYVARQLAWLIKHQQLLTFP